MQQLERASIAYKLIGLILGLDPREVAKTVVLVTPDGIVRAVLPASERLDLPKVRTVLDTPDVQLATEEVMAGAYPDSSSVPYLR